MNNSSSVISLPLRIILFSVLIVGLCFFVYEIRGILAPFTLAFVLAYVLSPIIDRMEGSGMSRTGGILLVFLSVFTVLGFAIFTAGSKVTGEMRDLSDRLQREESTAATLALSNRGERPIQVIGAAWEAINGSDLTAFSLVDGETLPFPLEILPGEEGAIVIGFSPDSLVFAQAKLRLELGGDLEGEWVSVFVAGNTVRGQESQLAALQQASNVIHPMGLEIDPKWVDMGEAGPNVFTDVAKLAETLQPTIQAYLGEDIDLVALVKEQGATLIDTLWGSTTVFLGGVVSGLTFVVIVPFVAFFFLKEGRQISRKVIELVPNAYFEMCLNLLHQINGQIGGYIRGQLLATSVVASLAVTGLSIVGLQYAFPVGLLAGFANMIPFLGPLIGIISASIVALATGGTAAMGLVGKVIVIFLAIQLIDNILIQPTVVAKSVEMHPLMVLFVVMVGSQLMGIVGMLIAVPLTGIFKVTLQTIYAGIRGYRL